MPAARAAISCASWRCFGTSRSARSFSTSWWRGVLFGFANAMLVFEDGGTTVQLLVGAFFTGLWTAYLLLSERCRDRYPRTGPDGRVVQAFD
jgi:ABC-type Mn2+/Zn2+ transport system permease subunit